MYKIKNEKQICNTAANVITELQAPDLGQSHTKCGGVIKNITCISGPQLAILFA